MYNILLTVAYELHGLRFAQCTLLTLTLLLPLRFGIMGVLLAGPVADFSAFMLSVVLVGIELKKQKKLAYNLSHSI